MSLNNDDIDKAFKLYREVLISFIDQYSRQLKYYNPTQEVQYVHLLDLNQKWLLMPVFINLKRTDDVWDIPEVLKRKHSICIEGVCYEYMQPDFRVLLDAHDQLQELCALLPKHKDLVNQDTLDRLEALALLYPPVRFENDLS